MTKYYRVAETAALIGVSASTLRAYDERGLLTSERNPGNQRIYSEETVHDFLVSQGRAKPLSRGMKVYYARSSDGDQKKLNNQIELLTHSFGVADKVIQDKASGLNENRKGLKQLLKLAKQGEISVVYITQKDRLTRFGYSYLAELLESYDVTINVLGERVEKNLQEELIQDFLSLLASFSGKYYRLRGHEQKKQFLGKINEESN